MKSLQRLLGKEKENSEGAQVFAGPLSTQREVCVKGCYMHSLFVNSFFKINAKQCECIVMPKGALVCNFLKILSFELISPPLPG